MELAEQQKLVEEAKTDSASFGKLYDHFFPRLYAFVASKVSDLQDAEDITSDVFMKALENLEKFEWRGVPFSAWLFKIARNNLNNHYSRNSTKKTMDIDVVPNLSEDEEKVSPHKKAAREELSDHVKKILVQLPEREQTVLHLKFFSGLNNREIMQVTGLSESNVAIILYRSLRKIKPDLINFA